MERQPERKARDVSEPVVDLDLNWLFSASADETAAELTSPSGLGRMIEAQARVISVSPPIPIMRSADVRAG
jgi:hypothetical protein